MFSVGSESICAPSANVVAREIEGEIIIVPLVSGVGDLENELFTLNATGKAIWIRLDGHRTLADVVSDLSIEYSAPESDIEKDVLGLVQELARRKMIDVAEHV